MPAKWLSWRVITPPGPLSRKTSSNHPLQERLADLRQQIRGALLLVGGLTTFGVFLVATGVLTLLDYWLRYEETGLRFLVSLLWSGVIIWSAYRFLGPAFWTLLSDLTLARALQRVIPRSEDRLSSAVAFLELDAHDPGAGSAILRQSVINQAWEELQSLDPSQMVRKGPLHRALLLCAAAVLVALSLILIRPEILWVGVLRLSLPWRPIAWPQEYHVVILRPVSEVVRGGVFEVEVVDREGKKLPPSAAIHYRFEGPEGQAVFHSEPMTFVDRSTAERRLGRTGDPLLSSGIFIASREDVTAPFWFRVELGDDRSMDWQRVLTTSGPEIRSLAIRVLPPEYTGWPEMEFGRSVVVLENSKLILEGRATKPLQSAWLGLEGRSPESLQVLPPDGFRGELIAERSTGYWFELMDVKGLKTASPDRWELRVIPDAPPLVNFVEPFGTIWITPEAQLSLEIAARDDLGLRRVEVRLRNERQSDSRAPGVTVYEGPPFPPLPPEDFAKVGLSGESRTIKWAWSLEGLGLVAGEQWILEAIAEDYRGNRAAAEPRRVIVVTVEELAEQVAEQESSLRAELSRVLNLQREARSHLADLQQLQSRLPWSELLKELNDRLAGILWQQREVGRLLTDDSQSLAARIRRLLQTLQTSGVASGEVHSQLSNLQSLLERLGVEDLKPTERHLEDAVREAASGRESLAEADAKNRLTERLNRAGKGQDRVIAAIEQMLRTLQDSGAWAQLQNEARSLAHEQQELIEETQLIASATLAMRLDELKPAVQERLRALSERQNQIGRRLDQIVPKLNDLARQLSPNQDAMAARIDRAREVASELQEQGLISDTARHLAENRMGQALAGQKQIGERLRELVQRLAEPMDFAREGQAPEQLDIWQKELERIAEAQGKLRDQFAQAGAALERQERDRRLEDLAAKQRLLKQEIAALAGELSGPNGTGLRDLLAKAADRMEMASQQALMHQGPAAVKSAEEAHRVLRAALDDLAARRSEAELSARVNQLVQLQAQLTRFRESQTEILNQTVELSFLADEQGRLPRSHALRAIELGRTQEALKRAVEQVIIGDSAPFLGEMLSETTDFMAQAAQLLQSRQVGPSTQEAERQALGLLEDLLAALEPPEPGTDDQTAQQPLEGAGGGPAAPQKQPGQVNPYLWVELRLLKRRQESLHEETRKLYATYPPSEAMPEEAKKRLVELGVSQERLAEFLIKALSFDAGENTVPNEPRTPISAP